MADPTQSSARGATGPFWIVALLLLFGQATGASAAPVLRVHLLGTGGPELTPQRAGPATLVEAPGLPDAAGLILFDAGRDVTGQLYRQRINPKRISRVFLTHLHSDHIAGLADLWMTPWFLLGRTSGLELWGPPGTAAMVAGMRAMYGHDVTHRVNRFNPVAGLDIRVHRTAPGVVLDRGGVKVTAFAVEHADGNPAFGYAVEWRSRKVVLSGDTTYSANLVAAAKGADLLVQNVIAFSDRLSAVPEMHGVLAKLTTPEQAAHMATEARPKLLVFSHIVTKDMPEAAALARIVSRTRGAGYAGPLQVGEDRMAFEIGDAVRIIPPPSLDGLAPLDSKDQPFP